MSTDTIIICPEREIDAISRNNDKAMVLGYEGENALGYGNVVVNMLGYSLERIGTWTWASTRSQQMFDKIIKENGLLSTSHAFSPEFYTEHHETFNNAIVSLLKVLEGKKHLLTKKENYETACDKISQLISSSMRGISNVTKGTQSALKLAFSNMRIAGIDISDENEQSILELSQNHNIPPSQYSLAIAEALLKQMSSDTNHQKKIIEIEPESIN